MTEPFKQNDVFKHVDFDPLNACVGNNGGPYDLYDYAKGYFDATKTLLNHLQDDGNRIDLIVYPICYNFRHAVELCLKYVITDLSKVSALSVIARNSASSGDIAPYAFRSGGRCSAMAMKTSPTR